MSTLGFVYSYLLYSVFTVPDHHRGKSTPHQNPPMGHRENPISFSPLASFPSSLYTNYDNDNGNDNGTAPPLDLTHHLSRVATRRQPSVVKAMYKYFNLPNLRNLLGGMPPPEFFPFDTLEGVVSKPSRLQPPSQPTRALAKQPKETPAAAFLSWLSRPKDADNAPTQTAHLLIPQYPPLTDYPNPLGYPPSISTALQYTMADGYPPLLSWVRTFALSHLHAAHGGIPYSSPTIILTCGNTDGLNKVFETLLQENDTLLVENFTFIPAVSAATPRGAVAVGVPIDEEGITVAGPGGLRDVLGNWARTRLGRAGRRKPRVLYTIPTGQNPTGITTSLSRKREVYKICEEEDVIIVEDDPYWHLYYVQGNNTDGREGFLKSLVPSYVTLDTSGRVLRLDTFSKTIAPGCRLGWITGQPVLLERLLRTTEAGSAAPSGFSQALVAELVLKHWGPGVDGFVEYCRSLRDRYREKRDTVVAVLKEGEYLAQVDGDDWDDDAVVINKAKVMTFTIPSAGMFIWVKVLFHTHPLYNRPFSKAYLAGKLFEYWVGPAYENLVLVGPGKLFCVEDEDGDDFVRLSFALLPVQELRVAAMALVTGVRRFWGLRREEVEGIGVEEGEGEEEGMGLELGYRGVMGC